MKEVDVIVIGGGPAGMTAAIQAARMGARCLLVEKSGMLGGTTTLNRVSFPGMFHAWGRQVIAGIGWDLVCRTVEMEGNKLPDFQEAGLPHYRYQVRLCPILLSALIDEETERAGCEVLLHTMPAALHPESGGWRVDLCGKSGIETLRARWVIDATGDANAAALAGCPLMPRSETPQPGTLVFRVGGYDAAKIDLTAVDAAALRARDEGRLVPGDFGWFGGSLRQLILSGGNNFLHIPGIDAFDSAGKTRAEQRGRAALLRIFRFLKTQPGFETLRFEWAAPECGVRETRMIEGETIIRYQDYLHGRAWPDAVCYSFYPIDLHTDHGLRKEMPAEGVVPSIPLRALIPRGVDRFLAAGRCASGDQLANSAYRVQATCMAMGQAAGAVAALAAAADEADARRISFADLRAALEANGAIVPPEGAVSPDCGTP